MTQEITIRKSTVLVIACIALAAIGVFLLMGTGAAAKSDVPATAIGVGAIGNNADTASVSAAADSSQPVGNAQIQDVYLTITRNGYDKSEITVKEGIPVRLHFTAINAGCGSYLVLYGLGVSVQSKGGQEAVVEFTPDKVGEYEYNCGMRMFKPGKLVVVS